MFTKQDLFDYIRNLNEEKKKKKKKKKCNVTLLSNTKLLLPFLIWKFYYYKCDYIIMNLNKKGIKKNIT